MSIIRLLNILERLALYKSMESENEYRQLAYKKAIKIIYNEPNFLYRLTVKHEKFEGIGKKLLSKITEYVNTGDIAELHIYERKPEIQFFLWLYGILGIGQKTALKYTKKFKTKKRFLKAIERNKIKLTDMQKFGIQNYESLARSGDIPRATVTKIGSKIIKEIGKVSDIFQSFEIMGSYRRKKPKSNDIDILALINGELTNSILQNIFENLLEKQLMIPDYYSGSTSKILIFTKTKNKTRNEINIRLVQATNGPRNATRLVHVDVRFISVKSKPFAQIYFTGPGDFCRTLRAYVKKQGMLLNEYGLFNRKTKRNLLPNAKTEKEVFDFLGIKYLKPEER